VKNVLNVALISLKPFGKSVWIIIHQLRDILSEKIIPSILNAVPNPESAYYKNR
jgi:hypothetical protein